MPKCGPNSAGETNDVFRALNTWLLEKGMIEIEEGHVEKVHPRFWKWRDQSKRFQKFRKEAIRMAEAKERRDVKKLKKAFVAALAELEQAPRTMWTAARVMEVMIDVRNGFRSIASSEAWDDLEMICESIKQRRIEALELALREPKMQAWAEFLFEEGAWESEREFEEELEEAVQKSAAPALAIA